MKKQTPKEESGIQSESILNLFRKYPHKPFDYKQISRLLHIKQRTDQKIVREHLKHLAAAHAIIETSEGLYELRPSNAFVEGIIDITSRGAAYLQNDDYEDDIYISSRNVNNALHGDSVKLSLFAQRPGKRLEAEVVEVLKRARTEFVGTLQVSSRHAFLVPDSSKMHVDIFIPSTSLGEGKDGQKALVEIVHWKSGLKNPVGKVVKVLGWPGENETEMHSILAEFGFPTGFPKKVLEEAEQLSTKITTTEIRGRKDFRDIPTFTIDPDDAKDFDDAISVREIKKDAQGKSIWEIGVHIADVSHYIKPGTSLEEEGYSRATSVYLVDRVVPMLPEQLSNVLCSLRPDEEKLCFSAVFELNEDAKVLNSWFGRTVIFSRKRFTYDDAQKGLDTGDGVYAHELKVVDQLAKKLRKERFRKGAISFEKSEVKFKLDEKGVPIGLYLKEEKDSNRLIEEFMLLCNRKVAEFLSNQITSNQLTNSVYRIHDMPNTEKLNNFSQFAGKFGYKIHTANSNEISKSLNKLLKDVKGKKEQNVLEQLAIRTMAKAVYSTNNIGHYGLAFDHYTHFTSPIRRYPDILVHRILAQQLDHIKTVNPLQLEDRCKHSTAMEIRASEAERASIKYKQIEYIKDKTKETFEGIISGVTEWGLFIELSESKTEGLVRLREIDDDFYILDEKNYCLTGSRHKKKYTLGDSVFVKLKSTDLHLKQINFVLVKKP